MFAVRSILIIALGFPTCVAAELSTEDAATVREALKNEIEEILRISGGALTDADRAAVLRDLHSALDPSTALRDDVRTLAEDEANRASKILADQLASHREAEALARDRWDARRDQEDDLTVFLRGSEAKATQVPIDRALSDQSGLEITADSDSSKATLRLQRQLSAGNVFDAWSITASSPVSKGDSGTQLANLDGLANAFSIGLEVTRLIQPGRNPGPVTDQQINRWEEICRLAGIADVEKSTCDTNVVKQGLARVGLEGLYPEFRSMYWKQEPRFSYGFKGTIGYETFEFADAMSLEERDTDEVPWGAEAYFGFMPASGVALFVAGLAYQETYKSNPDMTLCPLPGSESPTECYAGPVGAPEKSEKHLVFLEGRTQLGNAGLSARITHDFESNTTGVDIPLYLIKSSDGKLNGGLRLGWIDEENDFLFGVFVGSSLDFTP